MPKRFTSANASFLFAAAMLVACAGDQGLVVSPRLGGGAPPLGVVANPGGTPVLPVHRQIPLAQDRSWSFDVGPDGTVVRDGATGLTIEVPAGAVPVTTHITVIALKGAPVAYRFEPHGLQFAVPIHLVQSLRVLTVRTNLLGVPPLFGGYFADDSLVTDSVSGEARVVEVLPVLIDTKARTAILDVHHFSGYTVASAAKDSLNEDAR
jgi:hypothetical protein